MRSTHLRCGALVVALLSSFASLASAADPGKSHGRKVQHVLLLSLDGFHVVWHHVKAALRAQVVPAEKQHPGGNAKLFRALDDVGLCRSEIDEW